MKQHDLFSNTERQPVTDWMYEGKSVISKASHQLNYLFKPFIIFFEYVQYSINKLTVDIEYGYTFSDNNNFTGTYISDYVRVMMMLETEDEKYYYKNVLAEKSWCSKDKMITMDKDIVSMTKDLAWHELINLPTTFIDHIINETRRAIDEDA